MERTRKWAERGLKEHIKQTKIRSERPYQALYGVLQGGYWQDLRQKAARDISAMQVDGEGFDGFGLGGSLEKENLGQILSWMTAILPENKPRHLLGLSKPDDIFVGVENGADTFDCVAPTREARHGRVYTICGDINLKRAEFANDDQLLDNNCDCPTCKQGFSKMELRAMLKSRTDDVRAQAFRLLSMHNVRFIIRLTENIRQAIIHGNYKDYKNSFMTSYYHQD